MSESPKKKNPELFHCEYCNKYLIDKNHEPIFGRKLWSDAWKEAFIHEEFENLRFEDMKFISDNTSTYRNPNIINVPAKISKFSAFTFSFYNLSFSERIWCNPDIERIAEDLQGKCGDISENSFKLINALELDSDISKKEDSKISTSTEDQIIKDIVDHEKVFDPSAIDYYKKICILNNALKIVYSCDPKKYLWYFASLTGVLKKTIVKAYEDSPSQLIRAFLLNLVGIVKFLENRNLENQNSMFPKKDKSLLNCLSSILESKSDASNFNKSKNSNILPIVNESKHDKNNIWEIHEIFGGKHLAYITGQMIYSKEIQFYEDQNCYIRFEVMSMFKDFSDITFMSVRNLISKIPTIDYLEGWAFVWENDIFKLRDKVVLEDEKKQIYIAIWATQSQTSHQNEWVIQIKLENNNMCYFKACVTDTILEIYKWINARLKLYKWELSYASILKDWNTQIWKRVKINTSKIIPYKDVQFFFNFEQESRIGYTPQHQINNPYAQNDMYHGNVSYHPSNIIYRDSVSSSISTTNELKSQQCGVYSRKISCALNFDLEAIILHNLKHISDAIPIEAFEIIIIELDLKFSSKSIVNLKEQLDSIDFTNNGNIIFKWVSIIVPSSSIDGLEAYDSIIRYNEENIMGPTNGEPASIEKIFSQKIGLVEDREFSNFVQSDWVLFFEVQPFQL